MSASFYLRHILWAAIVKLCGRLLRGPTLRLVSKQITVLDKIIEFAKISAGLSFCVRATLRLRRVRVRPKKMRSKILACLNGRPQKVDMSRLVQNSLRVCWNTTIQCCSQTVALRRHVFFERPLRQTRIFSDAFFSRTNTQPPLSKLERTTNHRRSQAEISCKFMILDS